MHFPQTSYTALTGQTSGGQLATTQIVGLPQHQPQQQLVTNNGISYIAGQPLTQPQHQMIASNTGLTPQVLQQLQQHLCSQNVIQPTTQYIISTQGSGTGTAVTAIPSGYQAVQTVGGQQVLIPSNSMNQQIGNPVPTQTVSPNNQMVQLLLSNGQVMTTSLANLQAMGLTAPTQINATTPQQYSTQIQTNGNIIVGSGQTGGLPLQTQFVTNSAGQVFAITPQIPNQTIQTQPIVAQTPSNGTQYIQIGGQPIVQQMMGQQPQVVNNTALLLQQQQQQQQQQLQQQQQQMEDNKLLVQQQIIQQQMASQQKQSQQMTKSCETTQITRSSDSPNVSNTQTIVSSTTSRPQSIDSSVNQENTSHSSENSEIKTDNRISVSVQSQTSSPSSSNSTMEAESTTQCNVPNKGIHRLSNLFNNYIN